MFLYNIATGKIFQGNYLFYLILTSIDGETNLEDITDKILKRYPNVPQEKIRKSILDTYKFLKEKKIII